MTTCDICFAVTTDLEAHKKWHRTMKNIPPVKS